MKLVSVIPLETKAYRETLTYFSAQELPVGGLVSVPLRKKIIYALISEVQDVSQGKIAIKKSKIGFKKVLKVLDKKPYSTAFISAAQETARFYATSIGAVLSAVTPIVMFKRIRETDEHTKVPDRTHADTYILQTDDAERMTRYKSIVRESFTRAESVAYIVPTIQDAENAILLLSKGISEYVIVLHSDRTSRDIQQSIHRIKSAKHPLLVITTPGFLALAPPNTGTLILERENSHSYKQLIKPFIDFRFFATTLARIAHLRLILGDILLSSESVHEYHEGHYLELVAPKWHTIRNAKQELVDMRNYKPNLRGVTTSVSEELAGLITEMRALSDHTFIFAGRTGLAPTTICGDCGTLVVCARCQTPLVLYKTTGHKRVYLCRRCGEKSEPTIRCKNCTSWRLVTLGIGSELIEEELTKLFPNLSILRLDRETAKNRREARIIAKKFYDTPGSVLVGTELALPHLTENLGGVAVASVDALFSIPDFRINERVMYLLSKLESLAERRFLVQTRYPEHSVINSVLEGNLTTFYQSELAVRKSLSYPPFSIPIKISVAVDGQTNSINLKKLSQQLAPYTLDIFPARIKKGHMRAGTSGIVKIPRDEWPNEKTLAILRSLPSSFEIVVDPESFL
ncbi:MAG: hypothetical protein A3C06_03960 [Candidatus Taylorbacteria bacterium RIFCSPHIGHO2_02_FULL_46_13]|uniref:Primosomal protein N' 3' DNA-binding domain-containing protein n=1 Tax=Candidatus Taylorbacteria bacterium RIFCSPHIGHO2_02_FULL_46_13 TaxID=1802312 RepID=A0A1G2MTJ5_9BACT|nr:MAG: hypothetical protein A3C06_03960 [Candidatus Taylorbacteria bacterium RIFCSPHIGHO2_02_FULL_46_13]